MDCCLVRSSRRELRGRTSRSMEASVIATTPATARSRVSEEEEVPHISGCNPPQPTLGGAAPPRSSWAPARASTPSPPPSSRHAPTPWQITPKVIRAMVLVRRRPSTTESRSCSKDLKDFHRRNPHHQPIHQVIDTALDNLRTLRCQRPIQRTASPDSRNFLLRTSQKT